MSEDNYLTFAWGVISRGVKRLPKRLRRPEPPFSTPPLEPGRYRIAVYFADSPVNMYQLRQWYEPLRSLNQRFPVIIISRHDKAAKMLIEESGLDVMFAPVIGDIENMVTEQRLGVVLYVNQNTRNFQMMRYGDSAHVFISHGESDKAYMSSSQIKAYDYAFIAGSAAHDRLKKALWGYEVGQRTFAIGRPQIDHFEGIAPYPSDHRTTVLYAPTWEGDRPSMSYGSILSHGELLVRTLLKNPKYRVVYRPHPRSGVISPEYGAANQRIISMIEQANIQDHQAHHIYDDSGEIGWQLSKPDLVVCDVSAMLYDRLAVGKPLIVTKPVSYEVELELHGYLGACEWLHAEEMQSIEGILEQVLTSDEALSRLQYWSEYYFGDSSPGASTQRFEQAVEALINQADVRLEAKRK